MSANARSLVCKLLCSAFVVASVSLGVPSVANGEGQDVGEEVAQIESEDNAEQLGDVLVLGEDESETEQSEDAVAGVLGEQNEEDHDDGEPVRDDEGDLATELGEEDPTENDVAAEEESAFAGDTTGEDAKCEWTIDENGVLTVRPVNGVSGVLEGTPWKDRARDITSARFEGRVIAKKMDSIFKGCENLTSIDFTGLDTSELTSMNSTFFGCKKLGSIDLSAINTSKVTNMCDLFRDCTSITTLDLSKLDASSATTMAGLVRGCTAITTLDLGVLNTPSLVTMNDMFRGCSSLTEVNLQGLDATSVTNTENLFRDCKAITTLDLGVLSTPSLVTMGDMLNGCTSLKEVNLEGLDTSSVADMHGMFWGCSSLESIDLSALDFSSATSIEGMLGATGLTSVDLSGVSAPKVTDARNMFSHCGKLTNIDFSGFRAPSVTDVAGMFRGCTSLTEINLGWLNTPSLTSMGDMLNSCTSLKEVNLQGIDTSSVTDMHGMLWGCSSLESIDLSALDFSSATSIEGMLGATGLTSVDLSGVNAPKVTDARNMFKDCAGLESINLDGLDISLVTDMSGMFQGCKSLVELNLGILDTPSLAYMNQIVKDCVNLREVQLQGLETSSVLEMNEAFWGCTSLSSIDLKGLDLTSVRSLNGAFGNTGISSFDFTGVQTPNLLTAMKVFQDCKKLTSINLGSLDTSSVTDFFKAFAGCTSLKTLDLSGLDTSSCCWFACMFQGSTSLESLNLSGWDTSSGAHFKYMFQGCHALKELDVSGWNTSSAVNMEHMFDGCSSLKELDVSSFDTHNIKDMQCMFAGCESLKSINVSGLVTQSVQYLSSVFEGCSSLESIDISTWDTSCCTKMERIFRNCKSLKELNVADLNTSSAKTITEMFNGCSSLTHLDLSPLDTSTVIYAGGLLAYCSSIESVDLSGLDTSKMNGISSMFEGCSSLEEIDLSAFNTSSFAKYCLTNAFKGCKKLKTIYVGENWTFDGNNGGAHTFEGCTSLVGGNGTECSKVDSNYAVPDLPGQPGYLTLKTENYAAGFDFSGDLPHISNVELVVPYEYFARMYYPAGAYIAWKLNGCDKPSAVCYGIANASYSLYHKKPDASTFYLRADDEGLRFVENYGVNAVNSMNAYIDIGSWLIPVSDIVRFNYINQFGIESKTQLNASKGIDARELWEVVKEHIDRGSIDLLISFTGKFGHTVLAVGYSDNEILVCDSNVPFTAQHIVFGSDGSWVYKGYDGIDSKSFELSYELGSTTPYYFLCNEANPETEWGWRNPNDIVVVSEDALGPSGDGAEQQGGNDSVEGILVATRAESYEVDGAETVDVLPISREDDGSISEFTSAFWVLDSQEVSLSNVTGNDNTCLIGLDDVVAEVSSDQDYSLRAGIAADGVKQEIKAAEGAAVRVSFTKVEERPDDNVTVSISGTAEDGDISIHAIDSGFKVSGLSEASAQIDTPSGKGTDGAQSLAGDEVIVSYDSHDASIEILRNVPVDSVALGDASVSLSSVGQTTRLTATVEPADATDATITWASSDPSVATVSADGVVTAVGNGTATITATTPDGHSAECLVTVSITEPGPKPGKTEISKAKVAAIPAQAYTGKAVKPAPKVTHGGKTLKAGTDYTLMYKNNVNAGTATITLTGKGNFTGTKTVTFKISPAAISKASVAPIAKQAYTGKAIKPSPKVAWNGRTLKAGTDYTLKYANNTKVGTATVTITGRGNFTGSKKVTFKIYEATTPISEATVSAIADQPYTGMARTPKPVVKLGGKTLREGTDYTLSYSNNVEVSNRAKVTITGKGSYTGKKAVTFRVSFKDVAKSHPFYAKIHRANDLGIINGYRGDKNGQFGPADNITRGQIAVMLWNAARKPEAGAGGREFPDAKPGAYYYEAVRWAASVGVVNGYADGSFGPDDDITREQLAVMVANYASKVGKVRVSGSKADLAKVGDAGSVSSYAVGSVAWCYKRSIFVLQSGKLNATKTADRATAAQMACDLYELLH